MASFGFLKFGFGENGQNIFEILNLPLAPEKMSKQMSHLDNIPSTQI
ncbi:UDP-glucuronate 4-epimerase 3-like protein [Corchorus olitorius]|uniref:UDP-glucuronate 4-epimerase 3-like protein n=1 Tax=Corchorus olitorius TaxID=93759 RepID=A0A1R3IU26_9ROSI|nr:UDP-glucuronate 4-epimerase 3-like protein [Corchorus olitorius]